MDSEAFQSARDLLDLNFQCELEGCVWEAPVRGWALAGRPVGGGFNITPFHPD